MRTILFLVQKEFLQILRNRIMLPMILVMPVFQTLLLSFAANYEIKDLSLGVVDQDLSPSSRQLVSKFTASGYFKIKNIGFSTEEAANDLARDRTDLLLEIPANFERDLVPLLAGTGGIAMTVSDGLLRGDYKDSGQEMGFAAAVAVNRRRAKGFSIRRAHEGCAGP